MMIATEHLQHEPHGKGSPARVLVLDATGHLQGPGGVHVSMCWDCFFLANTISGW